MIIIGTSGYEKRNCVCYYLPSKIKEYITQQSEIEKKNRSDYMRGKVRAFLTKYETELDLLLENEDFKINSLNLKEDIKDRFKLLKEKKVFPSYSEILRFILMIDALGIEKFEYKEEIEKKPPRHTGKILPNKEPKELIEIYHNDFINRLIISFLNENKFLTRIALAQLVGGSTNGVQRSITQIGKDYPSLIIIEKMYVKRGAFHYIYKLNKEELERILSNESGRENHRD